MKCSVSTCKKEIEAPLILFNGDLVCPNCGNPLVNDGIEFVITKKSEELFKLSEILYYKSLSIEDKQIRNNYIKNAVEKCIDAMEMGHPQAYIRLGYYYDKDYVGLNRTEAIRTKIAYQYYSALVYSHSKDIKIEEGVEPISLDQLKKVAANYMLKMLLDFNDDEQGNEKYSYEYNAKKIKELLNYSIDDLGITSSNSLSNIQRVLNLLESCKNKNRAPIFGFYTLLTKNELKSIFEAKNRMLFDLIRTEKIYLGCYVHNSNLRINNELIALQTETQLENLFENELSENDSKVSLIFFNKKNGHKLLSRSEIKKVENFILNPNEEYFLTHINDIYSNVKRFYERVYYDDDVYFYKTKEKKLRDGLIALCSGN